MNRTEDSPKDELGPKHLARSAESIVVAVGDFTDPKSFPALTRVMGWQLCHTVARELQ